MQKKINMREMLHVIKRVLGIMLNTYRWSFLLVVLCIVGSALATRYGTLFMQSLIDDYILPLIGIVNPDYSPLARALGAMACIFAAGIICSFAYSRIMVNVSQGTLKKVRGTLFTHMESLPIKYFDTHAHGNIMSVYTNDVDTLRQLISQSIPQVINSVVALAATLFSMLWLNLWLTLLSLAMVAVLLLVVSRLTVKSGLYFSGQQRALGTVNGYIEEMIEGQKVVKVFCHEEKSTQRFKELNEELRATANQANKFANIMLPVSTNIGNISYVLCAVLGGVLALNGSFGLTLGTLVAFLMLNKSFIQPISQLSQQMNSIVMGAAGAERIFQLMDEVPEIDKGYVELVNAEELPDGTLKESSKRTGIWAWKQPDPQKEGAVYTKLLGSVAFHDVDFGYNDSKMVLHDIRLHAEPGQKIAFVGGTGAGKTTITNLINRFYDIQDGKISYDNININEIKKSDLRRSLGMVLQETHLFTGTVLDNIRYGRLDASDEECIEAARLANAHSFIKHLPGGYETVLTGDGGNLSQGQRQLLAIARAAVADPPVLILDEATSSIDTRTERLVQEGMDRLMQGRTTFVIAHRLSTIQNSDCIMVMEQGRIIERGSHEKLIEEKGKYYQLYTGNAIGV